MFSYSKRTESSFSQISTDSLCLQHAQTPRSRDLAIFVLTTITTMTMTTTDIQTDYFTPCACTWGNQGSREHIPHMHSMLVARSVNTLCGHSIALYPGLPMFFNISREKLRRPGRLCDVVMTCGHYLELSLKISAHSPMQMSTPTWTLQYS